MTVILYLHKYLLQFDSLIFSYLLAFSRGDARIESEIIPRERTTILRSSNPGHGLAVCLHPNQFCR